MICPVYPAGHYMKEGVNMIIILGSAKVANGIIKRGEHVYDSKMRLLGIARNIYRYDLSGVVVNVLNVNGAMTQYPADTLYKG